SPAGPIDRPGVARAGRAPRRDPSASRLPRPGRRCATVGPMSSGVVRGALRLVRRPLHERRLGYLAGLANVAVVSVLIALVLGRAQIANITMLYLLAILLNAVSFGRGPAALGSVAAFLIFDFFFVDPIHTFTVADPEEWVALVLFLVTGLVTGHLAAALRQRAREAEERKREAEEREREAVVLYDVVRLLAEPDLEEALRAVAGRLRDELGVPAVAIDLGGGPVGHRRAEVGDEDGLRVLRAAARTAPRALVGGAPPTEAARGGAGRWVRSSTRSGSTAPRPTRP